MRNFVFTIWCAMLSFVLFGQGVPRWLNEQTREYDFPKQVYLTGFAMDDLQAQEPLTKALERIKTEAQSMLSTNLRVKVVGVAQSEMKSVSNNNAYSEYETFSKETQTTSDVELVGVKIESYHDKNANYIYAFAYANKYELAGYYKANINMLLQQVEGSLLIAGQLEQNGEKAKARQQCKETLPLLAKVRYAQDLLTALDASGSENLQQDKSETLRSDIIQALVRLAQGVYVYMESNEDNFGERSSVIANQIKSTLAKKGCSFTVDSGHADLQLYLTATTRYHSTSYGFECCYADIQLSLFDIRKNKSVFQDEFFQKGLAATIDAAGKKAFEDAVPIIVEKISPWIE